MNTRRILILIICLLILNNSKAQNIINLDSNLVFVTNSALIYDDGGASNPVGNTSFQSTVKAQSGYIELFFIYIDIPSDATLKIYKGLDTLELIGLYDGQYKPQNMFGKAFTIVYSPGISGETTRGWEGLIQPESSANNQKATKAESDCIGAIPLCGNSTVNTSANQYDDTGVVNDDDGSCYSGTGSGGSVWYSFTPDANGNIDFMITPLGSTDYDFVLWDISSGCAAKTEISCNFSGTNGATGLNAAGTLNSQDASGTTNNQQELVNTTGVYALCINYYGGTNGGFNLNFQNDAGTVGVIDNTVPTILNAYSTNCASSSTYTVNFSEYMDCTTIQSSDFAIPGYTVTLTTSNCVNGKTIQVVISVSPAMPPGSYTMNVNNMNDMCGNPLNDVYNIVTTAVPVANAGADVIACSSPGLFGSTNYGTVTLTGSGGTSYQWSTGQNTTSINVTPSTTTIYTLTAIQGSCASTDQVTVTVSAAPTPSLGPDQTVCAGFPITLNTSGGLSYQWQSTTSTNFFGNPNNWVDIPGETSSSYTGTPGSNIFYQVIVTNADGCQGTDYIEVTTGSGVFGITAPPFICDGGTATLSLPASLTDYTWDVGGAPIGTANTALTVSPASTTTYTATSTTVGCTGTSTFTVVVHSPMALTTTANPTEACVGVPVNLTSAGIPANSSNTVIEDFEASNGFTLINGTDNIWEWGTVAFATGTQGLYVSSNSSAADNSYIANATTSHAYKDYTVTSPCSADLNFQWQCGGSASDASFSVWIIPTSVVPVAGTELIASATQVLGGGPYSGTPASYTSETIDLTPFENQTVRVVFSWLTINSPPVNAPAVSIDDVIFTESTTYNYSWASTPGGFSASTSTATASPIVATDYDLTVTRCDGCPIASTVSVINCAILPIELNSFTGKCENNKKIIEWSTATEINNDYFTIEQSEDAINYSEASIVDGAGNSNQNNYYNTVINSSENYGYFRLMQTDFDGHFSYSEPIYLICDEANNNTISAFPNPALDEITIRYPFQNSGKVNGYIVNVLGEQIMSFKNTNLDDEYIVLPVSELNAGMYNLFIISEFEGEILGSIKFIKK